MDKFNIDDIWNDGQAKIEVPTTSIEDAAQKHRGKSVQLVEKIKQTAQGEHRIFLV